MKTRGSAGLRNYIRCGDGIVKQPGNLMLLRPKAARLHFRQILVASLLGSTLLKLLCRSREVFFDSGAMNVETTRNLRHCEFVLHR